MFAEFDKVVQCLALEVPSSVWDDVNFKYGKLKVNVEKFMAHNKQNVPCTCVKPCVYIKVCKNCGGGYTG